MYQHILVAVDLLDSDLAVLKVAAEMARGYASRLSVVHVGQSPVSGYSSGISNNHIANDFDAKQKDFPKLRALLDKAVIKDCDAHVLCGSPADVVHQYADTHGCDLIVVGSHGYSGVKAMIGSIATKVLHGANCDVHTVRIRD